MKLRSPWMIGAAGFLLAGVVRLLAWTLRYRITALGADAHPIDPRKARYIYGFWHESMLAMVAFRMPIRVLIGSHADGEMAAQACRRLGFRVVRGSTTRGGGTALLRLTPG